MAGGRIGFLDEVTGDLVKHLRTAPSVVISGVTVPAMSSLVGEDNNARIFAEMAKLGSPMPQIVYTKAAGDDRRTLAGPDGSEELTVHLYCYSDSQPQTNLLARAVAARLATNGQIIADGTVLCLGLTTIIDTGYHAPTDQSSRKAYWTRVLAQLVIH